MIGTGRITGSRPNAAIFFADQIVMRQFFVAPKSPGDPRLLVQIFGKRFRQSIRQRFGHDRVVIVVLTFEFFREFIGAMNRDGKSAEIVLSSGCVSLR